MPLSNRIQKALSKLLDQFFGDQNLVVDCIWKRLSNSVWNDSAGYNELSYEDFPLTGIRTESANHVLIVADAVSDIQGSEVTYIFRNLPDNSTVSDLIIDGAAQYAVEEITPLMSVAYAVKVRGCR